MRNLFIALGLSMSLGASAGVPDSVYVRAYGTDRGDGMHLEWSADQTSWTKVINGVVLTSDYGNWGGRGKKMFFPNIIEGHNGLYVLAFQPITNVNQFGITTTRDFMHWRPQDYPYMKGVKQCLHPVISLTTDGYAVDFESDGKFYRTTTTDLVHFSDPVETSDRLRPQPTRVPFRVVRIIQGKSGISMLTNHLWNERTKEDPTRFQGLDIIAANVTVEGTQSKAISDKLMGIFFEDINYAADGGLYAELIQNRDFEYNRDDRREWNAQTSWDFAKEGGSWEVKTENPIHPNNAHYVTLNVQAPEKAVLRNSGFGGINVKKGEKYDISAFLRQVEGKAGKVNVCLTDKDGNVIGKAILAAPTAEWKQMKAVITATADCANATFCLQPTVAGSLDVDFVSLFPQNTFRGHKNGLRKDLAETLEALHPRFLRFPGGCVAHGNGLDNIYRWKETIGPLWERKPQFNLWGYHQSKGLGYYEYFQFCEDLKMEPLPVIAAGVACQNSSKGGFGQQGGIPMEEMDAYIQDILDLVEWANGDAKTTVWGRKRAEQGHPKPFNLKYIGIGNEDLISPTFTERYLMIIKAIKAKYPDITVCGTVGPFFEGSDYDEGWRIAKENDIDMVDEHYYVQPGWFIHHRNFYDNYDRKQSKVYLGEYASHIDGRISTIETALSCALYLCDVERNGDIVELTSYAPLLAKEGNTQWNPDLIYFNNQEVKPTVDYYAQMLHGQHMGDTYFASTIVSPEKHEKINERLAVSCVKDSKTGKTYLKIVSMIPMEIRAHLVLNDLGLTSEKKTCKAVVLSGAEDSRTATPEETTFDISDDCRIKLKPYSFTAIEL